MFEGTLDNLRRAFATAQASTYNDWLLENLLKQPSRQACHPAYTTSDHSRCTGR
jgi:hypothetical protein